MICPRCNKPIAAGWNACPVCQTPVPQSQNPYAMPESIEQPDSIYEHDENEGDATGGIIPYKNPKALIAYYLGIVSGLPLIGLPFGIAAFVLGIMGLRDRKKNPVIKGSAHAWIGIGCGGIFTIFWGLIAVLLFGSLFLG